MRTLKHFIFIFIFCSSCIFSLGQEEKSVLFVGNSLTFYNDMPQMLQKMLDEAKVKIRIDQITPGGYTLALHATYVRDTLGNGRRAGTNEMPTTVRKILCKRWDWVVLQEATTCTLIPEEFQNCTEPAVIFLDSIIKTVHGKTMLFQAHANGKFPIRYRDSRDRYGVIYNMMLFKPKDMPEMLDRDTVYCSDSFNNSSEEFSALKTVYDKLANETNADLAPVGFAFEICKKLYPGIELYGGDKAHPSPSGSYLIACVFFKKLSGKDLKNIKYNGAVDAKTAYEMRSLADSYIK